MTDLPARPAPDEETHRIVGATDRVKSVSDKTDPRFEAALNKVDREAERRAKQETIEAVRAGLQAKEAASADVDAQPDQDQPVESKSQSFSFNMTAGDEATTEDVQ